MSTETTHAVVWHIHFKCIISGPLMQAYVPDVIAPSQLREDAFLPGMIFGLLMAAFFVVWTSARIAQEQQG